MAYYIHYLTGRDMQESPIDRIRLNPVGNSFLPMDRNYKSIDNITIDDLWWMRSTKSIGHRYWIWITIIPQHVDPAYNLGPVFIHQDRWLHIACEQGSVNIKGFHDSEYTQVAQDYLKISIRQNTTRVIIQVMRENNFSSPDPTANPPIPQYTGTFVRYSDEGHEYIECHTSGNLSFETPTIYDAFLCGGGGGGNGGVGFNKGRHGGGGGGGGYTTNRYNLCSGTIQSQVVIGSGGTPGGFILSGDNIESTAGTRGGVTSISDIRGGLPITVNGGTHSFARGDIIPHGGSGGGGLNGVGNIRDHPVTGGSNGSNGNHRNTTAPADTWGGIGQGTTTRPFEDPKFKPLGAGGGGGIGENRGEPRPSWRIGGDYGGGWGALNGTILSTPGLPNTGGGGGGGSVSDISDNRRFGREGGTGVAILRIPYMQVSVMKVPVVPKFNPPPPGRWWRVEPSRLVIGCAGGEFKIFHDPSSHIVGIRMASINIPLSDLVYVSEGEWVLPLGYVGNSSVDIYLDIMFEPLPSNTFEITTILSQYPPEVEVRPSTRVEVDGGESQRIYIVANDPYVINDVKVDGVRIKVPLIDGTNQEPPFLLSSWSQNFPNVQQNHIIEAEIGELVQHKILASSCDGGTISPSGEVFVWDGRNQTFTITPNEGNKIHHIYIDGILLSENVNIYKFENVKFDRTIAVTFLPKLIDVTIIQVGRGSGTVVPIGTFQVERGQEIIVNSTPSQDSYIKSIQINGTEYPLEDEEVVKELQIRKNILEDTTFRIEFELKLEVISYVVGEGKITPSGTILAIPGTSITFAAIPDEGATFMGIFVDDVRVSAEMTYTLANIQAQRTYVEARFERNAAMIRLIPIKSEDGQTIPPNTQIVPVGGNRTFTLDPDIGYKIREIVITDVGEPKRQDTVDVRIQWPAPPEHSQYYYWIGDNVVITYPDYNVSIDRKFVYGFAHQVFPDMIVRVNWIIKEIVIDCEGVGNIMRFDTYGYYVDIRNLNVDISIPYEYYIYNLANIINSKIKVSFLDTIALGVYHIINTIIGDVDSNCSLIATFPGDDPEFPSRSRSVAIFGNVDGGVIQATKMSAPNIANLNFTGIIQNLHQRPEILFGGNINIINKGLYISNCNISHQNLIDTGKLLIRDPIIGWTDIMLNYIDSASITVYDYSASVRIFPEHATINIIFKSAIVIICKYIGLSFNFLFSKQLVSKHSQYIVSLRPGAAAGHFYPFPSSEDLRLDIRYSKFTMNYIYDENVRLYWVNNFDIVEMMNDGRLQLLECDFEIYTKYKHQANGAHSSVLAKMGTPKYIPNKIKHIYDPVLGKSIPYTFSGYEYTVGTNIFGIYYMGEFPI